MFASYLACGNRHHRDGPTAATLCGTYEEPLPVCGTQVIYTIVY